MDKESFIEFPACEINYIYHFSNKEYTMHYLEVVRKRERLIQDKEESGGDGLRCQYVRVVKEADSKSAGVTRTGSNPVADVFFNNSNFNQLLRSVTKNMTNYHFG